MGAKVVEEGRRRWLRSRQQQAAVVAWVAASVVGWGLIHMYYVNDSLRSAEETLVSMCEERSRMLQDQFAVSVNHFHALAILVSTFHLHKQPSAIDQETFAEYAKMTAFERPLLSGVAYAQRLIHSEREKFEKEQGWTIRTMKKEPSPIQQEYAPVIFSQETISYIEALDVMSGEEDRENILRARATGKAVLTKPFRLLDNHLGVVLTFPVYRLGLPADASVEERVDATAGYLGGAFDVESLIENLLRQLAGSKDIVVNVYDVTNASEPLIMYGPEIPNGFTSISYVSLLDFGDPSRKHQMKCKYSKEPSQPVSTIMTPSCIFVISMLVLYIVIAYWIRYEDVKEDYRKMQELKVQAEAADVAKSQFLATVSHEIRTPMNGVLGMLDMLLDTELNLTQKDYAQTAQVCGKALISLINEVLDRAKIEAGKLEIEAVPFELRSNLDDVLSIFSAKTKEKCIELAVFVSDEVPEVLTGDPGRFRQIITNLVGNSVKFTERGHIFVQVHLAEHANTVKEAKIAGTNGKSEESFYSDNYKMLNTLSGLEAADGRNSWETFKLLLSGDKKGNRNTCHDSSDSVTLMVCVEDTGIGIPLHAQDRVFTPFMQVDSSTSRTYGGTGIGLSISKCLVELMGGQISFISRPQIGSTFTFTAVLQRCNSGPEKALCEALPSCFKGMKAILIDGRPVRAAVTRYHLQRLGIDLEVVSSLSLQNGCRKSSILKKQASFLLIEREYWNCTTEVLLRDQMLQIKPNGQNYEVPKVILLATSDSDKPKIGSFISTVIMKPLRASTVAACLQQVIGMGKQQKKDTPNGSNLLKGVLAGKNILVVDDNKVNLRVAAGALKKYGANVACAESGKDALALLQGPHKFDACFMDVQMPEMDGFEATRQIRLMESEALENFQNGRVLGSEEDHQENARRHLPVLAMTADVIQATYEECLKCGMDGYVSKPFEEQQLYQSVAKFLQLDKPNS